jgi:hypothetical protein
MLNMNLREFEILRWILFNTTPLPRFLLNSPLEAQGYRSLSLPKKGKPFLNYPNESRRGGSKAVY